MVRTRSCGCASHICPLPINSDLTVPRGSIKTGVPSGQVAWRIRINAAAVLRAQSVLSGEQLCVTVAERNISHSVLIACRSHGRRSQTLLPGVTVRYCVDLHPGGVAPGIGLEYRVVDRALIFAN